MSLPNDSRIAVVEMKVGTLEKSIETMADGIQQLVIAEAKRENDREIFDRVFDEIKEVKEHSAKLDAKVTDYIQTQNEEKLATYRGFIYKVLGLIGLVVASGITGFVFKTHLI